MFTLLESMRSLALASAFLLIASPVFAANADRPVRRCDGGRAPTTAAESEAVEAIWLPGDDLFQPLLADPKEPRFFLEFQQVNFETFGVPAEGREEIDAAFAGMGADFGVWTRRTGSCNGVQVGLFGAIISAFNLDTPSSELVNSDFIGGVPISFRSGAFSARVRFYHQSSHLGDELLLNNPQVNRVNLSFEAIDALVSLDSRRWRFYAGAGYLMGDEEEGVELEPWKFQWGLEFYGQGWSEGDAVRIKPVFGADFKVFEEQGGTVNTSAVAGLEWFNVRTERHFRLLVTYLHGFAPYGQFFTTEQVENVGIEMQFDL